MSQNRKMWISAAVVGVILVGGVSVVTATSIARIEQAGRETGVTVTTPRPAPDATRAPEDYIRSKDLNPDDPQGAGEHWTEDRLKEAEPMPMPMVTLSIKSSD